MALVRLDGRRYEGGDLVLVGVEETVDSVTCQWRAGDAVLTTAWEGCAETGIVSRRDTLINTGKTALTVLRCQARVAFPSGRYECYAQGSRWCHENEGYWMTIHTGLTLRHVSGRTTEGGTPYLALRAVGSGQGIAFHILPCGNWTIQIRLVNDGGVLPSVVVELGLADENLHRPLAPGEVLALPEILLQPVPQGDPHRAAAPLHRYLLARHFRAARPSAPVVYNTWFDQFEIIDVPRLRKQLDAAKAVGGEVFVVDAGWYGAGGADWWGQAGDWREKPNAAFRGNMRLFADEVRAAGLGFGLWMEPERFGPEAPIRTEHPEWFVPTERSARMDITQSAAFDWLIGEIQRLVMTYELVWMKIDFNFTLDTDVSGAELYDYMVAWYRLLDGIRDACPKTFFEGCSSGAMRGDLSTLSHFDGHFLSDSVNPTDMLRISQGAWLRLPPGRITRWAVMRPAGLAALPCYGQRLEDAPMALLSPCGALWEPAESVSLDFVLLAAMPGMFGISGDLNSLEFEHRVRIAEAVAFYKKWRCFLIAACAHLLTPPESLSCRVGWVGVQMQVPASDTCLVFIYRLGDAGAPPPFRLHALRPDVQYRIVQGFGSSTVGVAESDGTRLMRDGLAPFCPTGTDSRWAGVFHIEALS